MKVWCVQGSTRSFKNWTQKQSVSVYEGKKMQPALPVCTTLVKDQKPQIKVCWVLPEAMQRHEIRSVICKFAGTHCSSQSSQSRWGSLPRGWEENLWSEGGRIRVLGRRLAGCPLLPVESSSPAPPSAGSLSVHQNRLLSASIGDQICSSSRTKCVSFPGWEQTHPQMKRIIQLQKEPHIHFKNWTQEQPILVYEGEKMQPVLLVCATLVRGLSEDGFNFNILSSAKFGLCTRQHQQCKHHVSVIFWHKYVSYW